MSTALVCVTEPERALAALAAEVRNRHRAHLRELRIETVGGVLIIRGVATCFYGKQLALHEVRSRCSLSVVANEVDVQEPASAQRTGAGAATKSKREGAMNDIENEVVRVFAGPLADVERLRGVLLDAGIECRVVGTALTSSFGSVLPESIELWVHRGDATKAEAAIERETRSAGAPAHESFPHPSSTPVPRQTMHWQPTYTNPDPGA